MFLVCNQLQIPYDKLKPEEKAALLSALSKSKLLGMLGKHGRGKRKNKQKIEQSKPCSIAKFRSTVP